MIFIRRWYSLDCVIGRLYLGGFQCFTLELPQLDNRRMFSCIPEGTYEYFPKISATNGNVLELKNVPGRTFIQLHAGNYTSNTQGCILVGDGVKWLNKDRIPDITNSKATLKKILKLTEHGQIKITGK